jgi:oligosaccharyltransferase complex subunit alpha (ribophorin I)
VPLSGFLKRAAGGRRRLALDLTTPLEGVYVADLTVRVVLPEGATAIVPALPYDVDQVRR